MSSSKYSVQIDPADEGTSHGLLISLVGRGRDVLDVGCATGELGRVLQEQRDCRVWGIEIDSGAAEVAREHLQAVYVADLETTSLVEAAGSLDFDSIVFGDVLEHLKDPVALLRQAVDVLRPGGSVVISIPNVAHASVRLSLLKGEFTYRSLGLLDATHLRFFDRPGVRRLVADAGLVLLHERRTVLGPFDTEMKLDPASFPPGAVDLVLADEDAITYQFVLEAVADDADGRWRQQVAHLTRLEEECAGLRQRVTALEAQLADGRAALDLQAAEHAAALADGETRHRQALDRARQAAVQPMEALTAEARQARAELVSLRQQYEDLAVNHRHNQEALQAVMSSTAWRVSKPVRALGPLRTAVQGPVGARRSLRRRGGLAAAFRHVQAHGLVSGLERLRADGRDAQAYLEWIARYATLTDQDREQIQTRIRGVLGSGPLFSVVMPAYNTVPDLLDEALASLQHQLYERWELCLVDDASPSAAVAEVVERWVARDLRVRFTRRSANGGIAAATNDAIAMAKGDFVVFMDHDDLLSEHALYLVAEELYAHPDARVLYTDEDKLDQDGNRYDPHFKPDFDPLLLQGQNYVSHLTVARRSLVEEVGGLRVDVDGSQDHDLVLRLTEQLPPDQIRHIPYICYHWRQWVGSGTFSGTQSDRASAASRRAVREHLYRIGEAGADVVPAPRQPGWNRVVRSLPEEPPAITVVIPTRDRLALLKPCVQGLLSRTVYEDLQVLIVDNDSTDRETLDYLAEVREHPDVRVIRAPGPFNYSRINNIAVEGVTTPGLLLLNNDIVVRRPDWLREMVSLLCRPGTGVVGARLLYADGSVQHAGVILGIGGVAGHSHKHSPGSSNGYFGRLSLTHSVSAVTGACLLTWTDLYREVGGLDEDELAVAFNDVDFCLKVRESGRGIVVTPDAELDHLESASRGAEVTPEQVKRFNTEIGVMQRRWGPALQSDPAYNPNLSALHEDFSLSSPPRVTPPWRS